MRSLPTGETGTRCGVINRAMIEKRLRIPRHGRDLAADADASARWASIKGQVSNHH